MVDPSKGLSQEFSVSVPKDYALGEAVLSVQHYFRLGVGCSSFAVTIV